MAKTTSKKKNARKRHAKSCKGKKPYDTKKLAKIDLVKLKKRPGRENLMCYECVECNLWHLGNRSW